MRKWILRAVPAVALGAALLTAAACAPATPTAPAKVPATRTLHGGDREQRPVPAGGQVQDRPEAGRPTSPGPVSFRNLLLATYGTQVGGLTVFNGITRACDGTISEHTEGRALDWGMDYRNAAMRADGQAVMNWLFATDTFGNKDAMARRLGIMYVIWNHKIYGSWTDYAAAPYSCGTDPTACHVDHMHFSFDLAGAKAQTSFFTGKVAATDRSFVRL